MKNLPSERQANRLSDSAEMVAMRAGAISVSLWESLSQNHAFIDDDKRVAFAAVVAFLAINGVSLVATAD
jgi:prophage maintenance system killer protein